MSKIKGGIWCPRCAARVVKEGQCSGRKGPGKGRSPAAARAPLRGPGREGHQIPPFILDTLFPLDTFIVLFLFNKSLSEA